MAGDYAHELVHNHADLAPSAFEQANKRIAWEFSPFSKKLPANKRA
jgi:hypothetical protein